MHFYNLFRLYIFFRIFYMILSIFSLFYFNLKILFYFARITHQRRGQECKELKKSEGSSSGTAKAVSKTALAVRGSKERKGSGTAKAVASTALAVRKQKKGPVWKPCESKGVNCKIPKLYLTKSRGNLPRSIYICIANVIQGARMEVKIVKSYFKTQSAYLGLNLE